MDQDASGENGEEFLLPQAKKAGYSSNADLWVEIAMELYQETEAIVKSVMTSLISTWMKEGRYKMSTRKPRGLALWSVSTISKP